MLSIQTSSFINERDDFQQLNLFKADMEKRKKQERAEAALDKIRSRFGKDAVSTANIINNDIGVGDEKWRRDK